MNTVAFHAVLVYAMLGLQGACLRGAWSGDTSLLDVRVHTAPSAPNTRILVYKGIEPAPRYLGLGVKPSPIPPISHIFMSERRP